MLYQLNYSREAHDWRGRLFDSVDDAIVKGVVSLLEFFENKGNDTSEVFGMDIRAFYQDQSLHPSFIVASYNPENNIISPIREIDLIDMVNNKNPNILLSNQCIPSIKELTSFILGHAKCDGETILNETELFYNVVSLLPLANATNSYDILSFLLPEIYQSLVMLAQLKGIQFSELSFMPFNFNQIINQVGSLAYALQFNHDISNTILELIASLIVMAEYKQLNFKLLLFNHIKERLLSQELVA